MITGEKKLSKSDRIIDKTLRKISIRKNVPKWVYVLLLLLYALSTYFLSVIARNQNVIFLFGNHVFEYVKEIINEFLVNIRNLFLHLTRF